eukprot:SAG25_NODE_275_length_10545_cov_4.715968_12_plen_603_part_00
MMPLGEAVGVAMGKKLSRGGILVLACALGILVTLAEPAIQTLQDAGKLIKPDGSPYLYATVHQWADNMSLQISIGCGVGLACTTGMLRSIFSWKMKHLIFALAPATLALTVYVYFFTCDDDGQCPLRAMVGLAWDCGAVTTGPVTVPLVLALGVGVSADSRGDGDTDNAGTEEAGGNKGTDDDEEDGNWASAFGVVTLASLFPVITVLIFALVVQVFPQEDIVRGYNCSLCASIPVCSVEVCDAAEGSTCLPAFCGAQSPDACNDDDAGTQLGGSSSWMAGRAQPADASIPWNEQVPFKQIYLGTRAVCPLVLFLVAVLRLLLRTPLPRVSLPDPQNLDTAAARSDTAIHVIWGALAALVGIIFFNIGLSKGLVALGSDAGKNLPVTFQSIDRSPGEVGCDETGQDALYSATLGKALVAMFAWLLGFGATCAEPALNTLGITVERLTDGKFKRSMLIGAVSLGVATGITLGVMRMIFDWELIWMLLFGYSVALVLTALSTEEYVCIAWDSAGVTTGPITVPLVVSMGLGLSDALPHSPVGFGILACASVSPIISVLATGLWVNGINLPSSLPCGRRTERANSPLQTVQLPQLQSQLQSSMSM